VIGLIGLTLYPAVGVERAAACSTAQQPANLNIKHPVLPFFTAFLYDLATSW
jgi:hypothetical protein